MMQKPNTVFVGTQVNTAGTSLAAGDIVVINATTGAVMATTGIAAADSIQLGYVKSYGVSIANTQVIAKNSVKSITPNGTCAYVAKTVAASTIDFTGVTVVSGYRYVVRVIYKDLFEHPGQFTHSYEVVAAAGETATTMATKFFDRINAHKGARVTATNGTAGIVVMTAKSVVDNGFATQGKEAITPYSQVSMKVVAYFSNPTTFFTSKYNAIPGITITTTESKPGKGNPYIVRDREQAALGYKGITYRTEWPIIKPELNVDLTKTYDTLVLEYSRAYQSPDNQYVKSTDLAAEVYVIASGAGAGDAEALRDQIASWAGLA